MKTVALLLLKLYQLIISPTLKQLLGIQTMCRYSPSCSEYARIAIVEHGVIKGSWKALLRLLSCQPLHKNLKFKI